jgi:hypothetical protein
MALLTIDEKINWINNQIDAFEQTISESEDEEFKIVCKMQIVFFHNILDDLYNMRLWNSIHKSDKFEINILPMSSN